MPRPVCLCLSVWLFVFSPAQAGDLDDFHWRETFEDVDAWSARPEWLSEASSDASLSSESGTACFEVGKPESAMKWSRAVPEILLDELPYLVVRYRAENLDTSSTDYLIYLDDGEHEQLSPLRLCDAVSDGQWQVAVVETASIEHSGTARAVAVQVRSGTQPTARLWIDFIEFTDELPRGAYDTQRISATPSQPDWTAPLAEAEWKAQPAWLGNPAAADQAAVERRDGTTVFRVTQPGLGMKWSWQLPAPTALKDRRFVCLRYRADGVSARGDYAVCAMGTPESEPPGYVPVVHSPELISDGRWHTANVDLRKASALVAVADGLAIQVQADRADAALEVAEIRFAETEQPSPLSDAFDWRPGALWEGFHAVELAPLAEGRSSQWLRHLRIADWFDSTEATVQGAPFAIVAAEQNLATTGVRETCELRVPVGAKACEVHLLLLAAMIGEEEPAYGEGRLTSIRDVDRFRLRLEYSDGTADDCLPMNAATRGFGIAETAQVLVAASDSAKTIAAVVLCDRAKQAGFALAAVTLRTQGAPQYPEVLEETSPLEVNRSPAEGEPGLEAVFADQCPLILEQLAHRPTGWNLLSQPSALVRLTVDGKPIPVETWQPIQSERPETSRRWFQVSSDGAIRLGIETTIDATGSLRLSACVENTGDQPHKVSLIAPAVGPYRLGESSEDAFYLYPKRGAVLDNRPCAYREVYSGLFPVQFIDTFNPRDGRGLVLRTEDTTCLRRHYILEKNTDGFVVGVEYPEQELSPGETLSAAPGVITLTDGDWHRGLDAYRAWVATWHEPLVPRKPWFRKVFNFRQRFLWWLDPLYDQESGSIDLTRAVDEARREFGGIDFLHLFDWGNCGPYGRIYGRTGDYSPYDYLNGGREALHAAITEVQLEGVPVGLYIEGYLLQERGKLGQQSGPEWQLIGRDGRARWWPDSTEMFVCPAVESWLEIQASTYETKAAELGVDGMYIDQFGFAHNKDCWSDKHNHKIPSYGVVAERDATRLIRERLEAAEQGVALYTEESPVDVTTQYQDGSFTYAMLTARQTLTRVPLNLLRFAIPDFKTIEILYCDKPTGSWATGVKWVFFNGEAIWLEGPAEDWFEPRTRAAIRKCYGILHKHRDAFTTPAPIPLVPTLVGGVFANAFPAGSKTVYTLYNARHRTFRGEVLSVPVAEGGAVYDEWSGKPAQISRDGLTTRIRLEIGPHDVGCIVVDRP